MHVSRDWPCTNAMCSNIVLHPTHHEWTILIVVFPFCGNVEETRLRDRPSSVREAGCMCVVVIILEAVAVKRIGHLQVSWRPFSGFVAVSERRAGGVHFCSALVCLSAGWCTPVPVPLSPVPR